MTAIEFKTRFPEFSNISDATVDINIQDAEIMVTKSKWGKLYDIGVAYLAAHSLALSVKSANGNSGAVNQVASKSVEGISVSYAVAQGTVAEDYYQSTTYGKRYLNLLSQVSVGNVLSV